MSNKSISSWDKKIPVQYLYQNKNKNRSATNQCNKLLCGKTKMNGHIQLVVVQYNKNARTTFSTALIVLHHNHNPPPCGKQRQGLGLRLAIRSVRDSDE